MLAECHCYLSYGGKRNEKRKSVFLYYSLVQPTPIMMMKHPSLILHYLHNDYCKAAYKGIAEKINWFNILFASVGLLMCIRARRTLSPTEG